MIRDGVAAHEVLIRRTNEHENLVLPSAPNAQVSSASLSTERPPIAAGIAAAV
jgi:hypothetical protein